MSVLSTHALTVCLMSASAQNHVPADIVASILYVEGGQPGTISKNTNGSEDLGVMQINNRAWLNVVSKGLFNGDKEKAYDKIVNDPCLNIKIGTWILALNLRKENGNIWRAVGRYHSANPVLAGNYVKKVKRIHDKYFYN
ncbi:hypothetical protein BL250_10545 [Erwinia sp. OLTSP20]|uniref:lytic transglycosylase domain-containing protein n=1 Tax=unclassified Erwinia TaxID=2622719 RepID=UPI000C176409|nr:MULTISPECIES: lytic transglycosylase domain-containing protein [unclassified Erwinia]PIJ49837.1 hypothetical protein BV501_11675 [Erwinia sp. OAMSP11]PIJ70936.1 hypothetical protein BK416_12865 [Erwinia sp. OLSSP12]PIJ80302.1 hypothetical protein BLD47_11730 [Erwinia sp. OLCASP19]PIJ82426.1 hypothetical protein BLD46_11480 [Erwinia sp. OLMTSP26]PIJ85111.1 hypothetical protein BLD49_11590 [Erwinia sp. OLMDSP33]